MATTQNTYTGNNSTTEYSFTFPYLEESDVKVSLDGVVQATTEYSFANATTISFDTAPGTDVAIRIFRETDSDSARTTFFAGSAIRAQDLNDNNNQLLYSTQETVNRRVDKTGGTMTGDLTFDNANIVFEGATADDFETTLSVVDPTADRTINLPNQSGTVPVLAAESATQITSTPEELNLLDGSTAGTVTASNAVVVDSNSDITGFRNITLTGELDAATLDVSGDIDVDGTANLDAVDIDGAVDIAGEVAMNSNKITGLGTPTADADAATKAYVDGVALAAIPDSDKGDISVTNDGSTWTIDDDAVTEAKIADDAVTSDKIGPNIAFTGTEGVTIPSGTEAQRNSSPVNGMFRYSTTTNAFEGYANGVWGAIGGGGGFEVATSPPSDPDQGDTYWDSEEGNAYIYYEDGSSNQWVPLVPSTPPKSAEGGGTDEVFFQNDTAVTTDYELASGKNALSAGPITINSGVTVTVPSGQSWVIV